MNRGVMLVGVTLLLGILGCAHTGPTHSALEAATTSAAVEGTVVDSAGQPIAGAAVWLSAAVDHNGDGSGNPIDHGYSDSEGHFTLTTSHDGSHQIEAIAAGYLSADYPSAGNSLTVNPTQPLAPATVTLRKHSGDRVRGILLAPDGLPLEDTDLALLFPKDFGHDDLSVTTGGDGVPELYPFTGGSGLIATLDPSAEGPQVLAPPIQLDRTGAGFTFTTPAGTAGEVSVRFRMKTIATARWAPDARSIELEVDMAAARAQLGTIDIEIGPGAGTDRALLAAWLPTNGGLPVDEWGLVDAPPTVRLIGVPAGSYAFIALGSNGAVSKTTDVSPGQKKRVALEPAPLARLAVAFDNATNGGQGSIMDQLELRTAEGLRVPVLPDWMVLGNRPTATFSGLPSGDFVVHAGGTAESVPARSGATPLETRMAVSPERRYLVRVDLNEEFPDGHIVTGQMIRRNQDGLLCRQQPFAARARGGAIELPFDSPPGPHRIRLDFGDGSEQFIEVDLAADVAPDAITSP